MPTSEWYQLLPALVRRHLIGSTSHSGKDPWAPPVVPIILQNLQDFKHSTLCDLRKDDKILSIYIVQITSCLDRQESAKTNRYDKDKSGADLWWLSSVCFLFPFSDWDPSKNKVSTLEIGVRLRIFYPP